MESVAQKALGAEETESTAPHSVHAGAVKRGRMAKPSVVAKVRTWAYGRRVLLVHVSFLVLCIVAAMVLHSAALQLQTCAAG